MKFKFTFIFLWTSTLLITAQSSLYWTKTYDTQNHGVDKAVAITSDVNCNVYVTGISEGLNTGLDYLTIKYDVNGNIVWSQRYDGPAHGNDEPVAIAVDANGNVYVTGKSQGIGTGYDYATIKYDLNGNTLWGGAKRFNNTNTGGNGDDVARFLKLDALAQYIYIGGDSYNYVSTSSDFDLVILKYDASTGNAVWNNPAYYNESSAWVNQVKGMAVDGSGNIYAISSNLNPSIPMYSWATLKFNSSGLQTNLLTDGFAGNSTPFALDIDPSGNVYVAGGDPDASRITIKKYYVSGSIFGSAYSTSIYNGQGSGSFVFDGMQIKAQSGNVYGFANADYNATASFNYDVLTFKLNSNGDTAWTHRYGGLNEDKGVSLALDAVGNMYVTGYTTSSNKDLFINKYAGATGAISSGYPIVFNGTANQDDQGNQILVTPENNMLIAGYTTGGSSQEDFFVRKYVQFIPTANIGLSDKVCLGSDIQLGGASMPGYTYTWSPSNTLNNSTASNPLATPTTTTIYNLSVTAGCATDSASITVVVNPLPAVVLAGNPDTIYTTTPPIILNGGSPIGGNYSGNGVNNNQFDPSASVPGMYSVLYTYTDSNGCTNTASENITVLDTTSTGVKLLKESTNMKLFPNPSIGNFTFTYEMQNTSLIEINIYDLRGQLIKHETITGVSGINTKQFDLSGLERGLYLFQAKTAVKVINKQIEIN